VAIASHESAHKSAMGVVNMTMTKSSDAAEVTTPVEPQIEGEICEFVRRDIATVRRNPESESAIVTNNLGSLLQRIAGPSVREIDRLIVELQTLRDLLQNEGARVQREIEQYATLSQTAVQSTKIITESLTHWKRLQ
jgi:hypothetical protein